MKFGLVLFAHIPSLLGMTAIQDFAIIGIRRRSLMLQRTNISVNWGGAEPARWRRHASTERLLLHQAEVSVVDAFERLPHYGLGGQVDETTNSG